MNKRSLGIVGAGSWLVAALGACSGSDDTDLKDNTTAGPGGPAQGTGQGGMGGTASGSGGDLTISVGVGGAGPGGGRPCVADPYEATITYKPVDIIFVIDNSGSMTEEINQFEQNVNKNFAQIIGASGLDYRVIMVTDFGPYNQQQVCIEQPLGGTPVGGCKTVGSNSQPVNNPPIFYHYDINVQSWDSVCRMFESYNKPDKWGTAPNGWQDWLRMEAFKIFVEITDDRMQCSYNGSDFSDQNTTMGGQTAAKNFDKYLLALSPVHFGNMMVRNYQFYSLIGLPAKNPAVPSEPWYPSDPDSTQTCQSGVSAGTGYQWLSKGTNALRFPVCDVTNYGVVFNEIAKGVVAGAAVPCEFDMPKPPPGETIDAESLEIEYAPGDGSPPLTFKQIMGPEQCGTADDKFYVAGDKLVLCPEACKRITSDEAAKVKILAGCGDIQ
jgi:hypothetical protein